MKTRIHSSFLPGMDWGLRQGLDVWIAAADPADFDGDIVAFVVIFNSRGEAIFPGECHEEGMRVPLAEHFGDEVDTILARAVGQTGEDLLEALRINESVQEGPKISVLHPDDAPAEVLDGLDIVSFDLNLSADLRAEYVLCTRIEAGWNDCITADDRALTGDWLSAYIDPSRELEVWLLDENGDASNPLYRLGSVIVPQNYSERDELELIVDVSGVPTSRTRSPANWDHISVTLEVKD